MLNDCGVVLFLISMGKLLKFHSLVYNHFVDTFYQVTDVTSIPNLLGVFSFVCSVVVVQCLSIHFSDFFSSSPGQELTEF